MGKTAIKIAYIGGGSSGWAVRLFADLACSEKLGGEIVLYDIDYEAARRNALRAAGVFGHAESRTKFDVFAVKRVEEALKGADFVVLSIQPGPIEMMASDLDIPKRYGILHTVGDTVGPAAILRALRAIPVYRDYAHKIMKFCPKAWVINYTNPMTLCTQALYAAEPGIKAFGCCHEVLGHQWWLSTLVERYWKVKRSDRREIKIDIAGLNHFTFLTSATWRRRDVYPLIRKHSAAKGFFDDRTRDALARKKKGQVFGAHGLIAADFLRRFGVLGFAGDRHLLEFVPWYLCQGEKGLHRWGVIATPSSYRLKRWYSTRPKKGKKWPPFKPPKIERIQRSAEEGVDQMEALLGLRKLTTNVNIPNSVQLPGLPAGHVVETNCRFGKDKVVPLKAKPLPLALNTIVSRVCDVQAMTLEAALKRDKELAFQAVLCDPLTFIPTDKAWAMFNEMLEATKAALPGWRI